jgi:hypothetical protein
MKRVLLFAAVALTLIACSSVSAAPKNAVFLGERFVDFKAERGVIEVGRYDGMLRSLYVEVEKNNIELFNMVITYGDGQRERIETRLVFDEGTRSRIINLEGGKRHIRSIEFAYKTVGNWREGRARISVFGVR